MTTQQEDIAKAIESRKKRIEALEKGPRWRNYKYVANIEFEADASIRRVSSPDQQASFVVKKDSYFLVTGLEYAYTVSGTLAENGAAASVLIPPGYNLPRFNYKMRDTGSDREWQNDWLPSRLLMTGNLNGLLFRRGLVKLLGGSEVFVLASSISVTSSSNITGLAAPKRHQLQFVFNGVEVLL